MHDVKKSRKITKGRKFRQVLDGARHVFLRDGYAGSSVDDIAREAGVSKATLYAYFPDKELMFEEVFVAEIEARGASPLRDIDPGEPARTALPRLAGLIAEWLMSPRELNLYRLAMSEAARFPNVAQAYRDSLDALLFQPLARLLSVYKQRNELEIRDPAETASQFVRCCGGALREDAVLGLKSVDADTARRFGEHAGYLFLSAHRPDDANPDVA